MKYIFILVVLVVADGQWREWKSFNTLSECEEVIRIITYHREDAIKAFCKAKEVEPG